MPDDPGHAKQRTVGAHQHQPATVFGVGGDGVAAVLGQLGVVGVDAIGQGVDLAVQWQVRRHRADRPTERAELLIE